MINIRKSPFGRETRAIKNLTPRRAIRLFCYECVGWQRGEVALCPDELCPLWSYRLPPQNSMGGEVLENSSDFDDSDDPDYTEVQNG